MIDFSFGYDVNDYDDRDDWDWDEWYEDYDDYEGKVDIYSESNRSKAESEE